MNWTIRKMKKASVARNLGTVSGRMVLIQASSLNSTYWGTSVTWYGSSMVPSMTANRVRLNGNSSRAKAYPARAQAITFPTTHSSVISREFRKYRVNVKEPRVQPSL